MKKLKIKALSVNECWQGRRFKTKKYKNYEDTLLFLLPHKKMPTGKLALKIKVGLSSRLADLDNIAKPFIDIIQKKYGFNDRNIFELVLTKDIVKKGEEYISFDLQKYKK